MVWISEVQSIAAKNLIRAKNRSKEFYDRKTRALNRTTEDQTCVFKEVTDFKFDSRATGPYTIVGFTESNNMILETDTSKRFAKHKDKVKVVHCKLQIPTSLNSSSEDFDPTTYRDTQLKTVAGVYYEHLEPMRRLIGTWRVTVFLVLQKIQRPLDSHEKRFKHLSDLCIQDSDYPAYKKSPTMVLMLNSS